MKPKRLFRFVALRLPLYGKSRSCFFADPAKVVVNVRP
jgi:hypothetical protein